MMRPVALGLLLALCACARQEPAPPAADNGTPPANAAAPAPAEAGSPASAVTPQSETEQATRSQESADGAAAEAEHPAGSDASLEKIAGTPPEAQLPAGKWQPGVNYHVLVPAQPTSVAPGKVEVMEVFWLACPHCYAFEPFLKGWLKSKPGYVQFVRVPVMWQAMHRSHAHFYYTLDALGRPDLIAKAFDTIAQQHNLMAGSSDEESFKAQQKFATNNGVSADDFTKAYNSFSVNSNLQRAEELTQRYHVEGVPFIVVNGKYTTDIAQAGGESKLIDLINDLAAAEHRH